MPGNSQNSLSNSDPSAGGMSVMTVYGTRPEAIKLAPVLHELSFSRWFTSIPVATGQHREMLEQVSEFFNITPVRNLNIMTRNQSLNTVVAKAVAGLDSVFAEFDPDIVLVQGDTSTALCAALAAFHRGIPVAHLEAGLRSGNPAAPFPEEANRRMITQLARLHLVPTVQARANLLREGVPAGEIVLTGNTVIDALLSTVAGDEQFDNEALAATVASGDPIVLVTVHRRENQGPAAQKIGAALARLARLRGDVRFVLPLHKNPQVRRVVLPHVQGLANVVVTEPLAYPQFTHLMNAASIVLTDSGGVQEEAPALGKPVLVMRESTERPEAVAAGAARLVGNEPDSIVAGVCQLLDDPVLYAAMARAVNPYGDGAAAARVAAALEEFFGVGRRLADFAADSGSPVFPARPPVQG